MALFQDSGQTPEERTSEAHRILFDLKLAEKIEACERPADKLFLTGIILRFDKYQMRTRVSPKETFWLRDLLERVG